MSERNHAIQDIEYDIALQEHKLKGALDEFAKLHVFVQERGWRHVFGKVRRTKHFRKGGATFQQHIRRVIKAMARRPITYLNEINRTI